MKNNTILKKSIIYAACLFSLNAAQAQQSVIENSIGADARAMGMGATGIAAADGVSSILYNPAALARIDKIEAIFGVDVLKNSNKSFIRSNSGIGSVSDDVSYSGLGSLGIAYPIPTDRGSLVLAAAYHRVMDFNNSVYQSGYNDNLSGIETVEVLEEGGVGVFSFGGAVDVSPNVSVGASLDIWLGEYTRDGRSLLNDYDVGFSQLDLENIDDDIHGVSFKPSILYFKDNFRFGAFVQLPMTWNIDESYRDEGYVREDGEYFSMYEYIDTNSEFNDIDYYDSNFDYKIEAPMQLGLGFAIGEPREKMLAFDMVYENWSQAKLKYPSDYFPEPRYFKDKYRSSLQWSAGAEKRLKFLDLTARLGYMRQPVLFKGPRDNDSYGPDVDVKDLKDFVSIGFGKEFDSSLFLDVAYVHGFWKTEEKPKTFESTRDRIYLTVSYQMPVAK